MKMLQPAVVKALQGENLGNANFNIDSIRKDLRTMVEEGTALGYPLPTVQSALSAFDRASADGLGHSDGTQLAAWWLKNGKH